MRARKRELSVSSKGKKIIRIHMQAKTHAHTNSYIKARFSKEKLFNIYGHINIKYNKMML